MLNVTALLACLSIARSEATRAFDLDLPAGLEELAIQHSYGTVRLGAADGPGRARLQVVAAADDLDQAQAFLDRVDLQLQSDPAALRSVFPDAEATPVSFTALLEVTVPASVSVRLRHRYGDVEVSGHAGATYIENRIGSVTVHGSGPVSVRNEFGETTVVDCTGPVRVEGSSDPLSVQRVAGDVEVHNQFGALLVQEVGGDVRVANKTSTIACTDIQGQLTVQSSHCRTTLARIGSLRYEGNNGDLEVDDVRGDAEIAHRFGALHLRELWGPLLLHGNYSPARIEGAAAVTIISPFSELYLREIRGPLSLESTGAAVLLEDLEGDGRIRAQGLVQVRRVPVRAADAPATHLEIENRLGPVEIELSDDHSVTLSLESEGGLIRSEFPGMQVRKTGPMTRGQQVFQLGTHRIDVLSIQGSVQVKKRRDNDDAN